MLHRPLTRRARGARVSREPPRRLDRRPRLADRSAKGTDTVLCRPRARAADLDGRRCGHLRPPSGQLTKTVVHVVGARPNYMKIAPVMDALRPYSAIRQRLINTGQHYDEAMAGGFLKELALPAPDRDLGVGSASHAVQTARIMIAFEEICVAERPDLVVVVGDVNSTMAASIVAAKLLIPVAHVEAGLRRFDRTMPEEINRIVTDPL